MTQPKHTQGPWTYSLVDYFDNEGRPQQRFEIISGLTGAASPSGKPLRDYIGEVRKDKEADARIMTVAPELLEALQELNLGNLLPQQAVKIVALIAKATGAA